MRRALGVLVCVVGLLACLAGVAIGAFTDRETNPQTLTAASPFPGSTPSGVLKAQSKTNDGGAKNSQIQFGLKLLNSGTTAVDLSKVTMRYWFMDDGGNDSLGAYCYYATFGCGKIGLGIRRVTPVRDGADRFLAVSFPSGSLPAGGSAQLDQLAIRDQSGALFDQTTDYSFLKASSFTDNPRVTVYIDGALVSGKEPEVAQTRKALDLSYANLDGNDFDVTIKPGLKLQNTGTVELDLKTVTMRYWFTKDSGDGNFQGFCDFAQVGCATVTTRFGPVSPVRPEADSYLEVGFTGGTLAVGTTSGPIQLRFNKANFSVFDELNDYSHGFDSNYVAWTKVTAYIDGQLIWGTEP